jgi:Leucine-rich repeat (LRR) protein
MFSHIIFRKIRNFFTPTDLDLSKLELTEIPKNLSKKIKYLNCADNKITKIENLPEELEVFICDNNQITKIENLPPNLKMIFCSFNKISKITNLPNSLLTFTAYQNPLLPEYIPYENIYYDFELFQKLKNVATRHIFSDIRLNPSSTSFLLYEPLQNEDILADYEDDILFKRYLKYPDETRLLKRHPTSRNHLGKPTLFRVILDDSVEV